MPTVSSPLNGQQQMQEGLALVKSEKKPRPKHSDLQITSLSEVKKGRTINICQENTINIEARIFTKPYKKDNNWFVLLQIGTSIIEYSLSEYAVTEIVPDTFSQTKWLEKIIN